MDPRTPVVVGVGQYSEHPDEPRYLGMSAVALATSAALAALRDTGADPVAVAAAIDTVAGTRQFEISSVQEAPLGRSDNYPRSVAHRIGADPARAVLAPIGGNGPQQLVTEFAGAIAAGGAEVVMLFGSENTSSIRYYAGRVARPDHSESIGGQLEDRGFGYDGLFTDYTVTHGLIGAPVQYGLLENARRARLGIGVAEYRREMGGLFAPFTKIAAKNAFSASPTERTVEEIITVTDRNRMVCDPYPRLLVARDQVNQGAAVILMSLGAARRLGVPEERWVYLHGHADIVDQPMLDRAELGENTTSVMAVLEALRVADLRIDDIDTFDLYSCFPLPVFSICDGLGLAHDDPRGFTLTGGLPYFGGPGNNYSMHAIAETVAQMRETPGAFGLVGANGGIMSKYSVGIYSGVPVEWKPDDSAYLCAEVAARPAVHVTEQANGTGTIETYSVRYDWPVPTGIVVGRLDADDSRFLALSEDSDLLALLTHGEPIGAPITVWHNGNGNRASLRAE